MFFNNFGVIMKLLVLLTFLLAFTATTLAVFNKTSINITNSTSVNFNKTVQENQNYTFNAYNVSDTTSLDANGTSKDIEDRITHGYTAYGGQFPYQAFLYIQKYDRASWCGASLIGSQWVLTAAHCTSAAISVIVYLGSILRYYGKSYTVSKENIIIHYGFDFNTLANDISLIRIPAVSLNSPYIQPIQLPAKSYSYNTYAYDTAIISGWGQTTDINYAGTDYLQWARVQVITNNDCIATYGSSFITNAKMCVSTRNGISSCYGDSGGPLVWEKSKVLIGVTSFLYSKQCELGTPAGFTRITSYLDWIKYYTGIYYT